MKLVASVIAFAMTAFAQSTLAQPAALPCRSDPALVAACFDVHARLSSWNGSPSRRLWPVGSKRLLGVHNDVLPPALEARTSGFETELWGDFTVCPYTPAKAGEMQFVCIADWRKLTIRKRTAAGK